MSGSVAAPAAKRIVFVDDDPAILSGLRNLLYRQRQAWEMVFVARGEAALAALRARPFDAVVSDMRMPGMDGATLLTLVREESPGTSRIMLTGQADHEAIARALPAAHQLLAKPCDRETLRAAIERGVADDPALGNAHVRAAIGRVARLPSPPAVYAALVARAAAPETGVDELAALVASDPGLAARVLQLVGSAYFGAGEPTPSIARAVTLLGPERLRYLAEAGAVFATLEAEPLPDLVSLEAAMRGAPAVAALARALAPAELADAAHAAALLREVGLAVLALEAPGPLRAALEAAADAVAAGEAAAPAVARCERAVFGATRAEVGACLLRLWGLPDEIVELVRHQRAPEVAPEPLRAAAAAVYFAGAARGGDGPVDDAALARAGCGAQAAAWRAAAGSAA